MLFTSKNETDKRHARAVHIDIHIATFHLSSQVIYTSVIAILFEAHYDMGAPEYFLRIFQQGHKPINKQVTFILITPVFTHMRFMNSSTQKNGVLWDVTPCGSCKNDV
jgi:hypothetical protein